ncbi:MAG: TIGR00153 family protein [Woeseiaceae bacterium]|nr:TIGR00153 family protein [Woeseiaceae bacterium]
MTRGVANIFGASPVQPLEQHIDIACRCAKKLRTFFPAVIAGDWEAASAARDKIDELEEQADELKKHIRLNLPRSLFMPVPREDLLELLLVQDGIANRARDVARIVLARRMQIPEALAADFLEFVDRNVDAAKKARKSVRELDELFTVGFRGAEVDLVTGLIEELDAIETDTDNRQIALSAALHEIESTLNPVDAVFLYKVIDLIWEIAESADKVGRRLELLLSH